MKLYIVPYLINKNQKKKTKTEKKKQEISQHLLFQNKMERLFKMQNIVTSF